MKWYHICFWYRYLRFESLRASQSMWGISSSGRAPDLHSGGSRFDPCILHQIQSGGVAQLVRAIACHAIGRGFESLHSRHGWLAQLVEHLVYTERVIGSSPILPTNRSLRLSVRTRGFHPRKRGSTPLGTANKQLLASWRNGYAEDCKSLYPSSILGDASNV